MSKDERQKAHNWLGNQHDSMLELVKSWAAINSGSANLSGLAKQHKALTQAFSSLPATVTSQPSATTQQLNDKGELYTQQHGQMLSVIANPHAARRVLLVGHMDTVFPEDSTFQQVTQMNSTLFNGPGLADMKGGLAVILYALQALSQSEWGESLGWQVLINADEEIGSHGSANALAKAAQTADVGLVFEPSVDDKGTLAGARKGSGKFALAAKGVSAHAGRSFHEGRNAICAAADWISAVHALNGQREGVTINIGLIQGGTALNVVPDMAVARVDIRTKQCSDEPWFLRELESITQAVQHKHGVELSIHGQFGRKPKEMAGETLRLFEWVRDKGQGMGLELGWQATGGCCDGNNLASAGLPTVDTLGVRGGKIHSHDEYLCADSLVERARLAASLLFGLAAGEFWE